MTVVVVVIVARVLTVAVRICTKLHYPVCDSDYECEFVDFELKIFLKLSYNSERSSLLS